MQRHEPFSSGSSGAVAHFHWQLTLSAFKLLSGHTLGRAAPAIGGMESCAGSQWIARRLQALGHKVRLIPAQFVNPYVKSNKSDEKADLQALHRVRDQMIGTRTRLLNQTRAFCLEYGIPLRQGTGLFKLDLPPVLDDASNDLSPAMRRLLGDLFADLRRLEQCIDQVTREIAAIADREEVARRLMTIPGIGALGATALIAAFGNGHQFQKARDLAAWLGLFPREHSTGGKQKLVGISKRGNRYVRKLLVHGARS